MKKLDQFLAFLAYSKRVSLQLLDIKTAKYFYLIFKGFTPNKGVFYDFKTYGYDSYVTDYSRYVKTVFINYKFRDLFRDKYASYIFLKQFTDKIVPVYCLIDNGKYYLSNSNFSLKQLIELERKFVIKPRSGRGGEGVFVLEYIDDKYYLNGQATEFNDLFKGFKNHILVPYVTPHEYAWKINPRSLNTIRLLTCVLDNEVRILRAGHRFGGKKTGVVDNFAQGGISANIDLATGKIDDPTSLNPKTYKKFKTDIHPDSKQQINGIKIPFWETVTKEIMELHNSIKFVKYIGWDVAITPDNYRIIEANYVSDLDGLQMHKPLLTDDVTKRFYHQYI